MTYAVSLRKEKTICKGSGTIPVETRPYQGITGQQVLAKCGECGRILKPKPLDGTLRSHSVRGKNTASHDATMERLWGIA